MLTTLFLAAAMAVGPPMPPGAKPPKQPRHSPRHREHLLSLGTPMLKTIPSVVLKTPSTTNFLVSIQANGNQAVVSWINGTPPYQVLSSPTLLGPWSNTGIPTMLTSKTCLMGSMGFIRVQGNVPLLSITHTNPTTLTWVAPEISMSDTLQSFRVYHRSTPEPAGQAANDATGWTEVTNGTPPSPIPTNETPDANGKFHIDDPTPLNPTEYYKVIEQTANGVVVPYNVQSASVATPASAWQNPFGGSGFESALAVATDASGNVFVVGQSDTTFTYQGITFTHVGSFNVNFILAKFSPTGVLLWGKVYGGVGTVVPSCIAIDPSGNIWTGGQCRGDVVNFGGADFDTRNGSPNRVTGAVDAWIAKYSPVGNHLFSVAFGDTLNGNEGVLAIATDSSGNAIATGKFTGNVPFLGIFYSGFPNMGFVVKLDASGTRLWTKASQSTSSSITGVCVDKRINIGTGIPYDDIFISAVSGTGTARFDGAGPTAASNNNFGFFAKFDKNGGDPLLMVLAGTPKSDDNTAFTSSYGIAVDSSGNPVVAGRWMGQVDFGDGVFVSNGVGHSGYDAYVAKYSGVNGSYQFAKLINGNISCDTTSMVMDAGNNIYLVGFFLGVYDFGGTTLTATRYDLSHGLHDINGFMAKYSSTGALLKIYQLTNVGDGSGDQELLAVSVSPTGFVATGGRYIGPGVALVTQPGGVSIAIPASVSGSTDAIVVQLAP